MDLWCYWIVESLNSDKGYDRIIVEMLAADEREPEDRDNLRATGFLARSYYLFNRTTWPDESIEHTCRASSTYISTRKPSAMCGIARMARCGSDWIRKPAGGRGMSIPCSCFRTCCGSRAVMHDRFREKFGR
jgi:hypothetical protein